MLHTCIYVYNYQIFQGECCKAPLRDPARYCSQFSCKEGAGREAALPPGCAARPAMPCHAMPALPPAGSPYLSEQPPAGSGRRRAARPAPARGARSLGHAAAAAPGAGAAGGRDGGSAVLGGGDAPLSIQRLRDRPG